MQNAFVEGGLIVLTRGQTYAFNMRNVPQESPFTITTSESGGPSADVWKSGVFIAAAAAGGGGGGGGGGGSEGNSTAASGNQTLYFTPDVSTPNTLYYQSLTQQYSGGTIDIVPHVTQFTPAYVVVVKNKTATHPWFNIGAEQGYAVKGVSEPVFQGLIPVQNSSVEGGRLVLLRGKTYTFVMEHVPASFPFVLTISEAGGATAQPLDTGVSPRGPVSGTQTLSFTPDTNTPNTIFYQCNGLERMGGPIDVVPAIAITTTTGNKPTTTTTTTTTTSTSTSTTPSSAANATTATTTPSPETSNRDFNFTFTTEPSTDVPFDCDVNHYILQGVCLPCADGQYNEFPLSQTTCFNGTQIEFGFAENFADTFGAKNSSGFNASLALFQSALQSKTAQILGRPIFTVLSVQARNDTPAGRNKTGIVARMLVPDGATGVQAVRDIVYRSQYTIRFNNANMTALADSFVPTDVASTGPQLVVNNNNNNNSSSSSSASFLPWILIAIGSIEESCCLFCLICLFVCSGHSVLLHLLSLSHQT